MDFKKELLSHLSKDDDFNKQINFASGAFKSAQLPGHCKITLLEWILNLNVQDKIIWHTVHGWINSNYFKELTRHEIDNKDIKLIVEVVILKISQEEDFSNTEIICNTLLSLLNNRLFEQYFCTDVKLCLKLIDAVLSRFSCPNDFVKFLSKYIFYKSLLATEGFLYNFLHIIFPTLVKCVVKFSDKQVFAQVSRVVQKCIFYNNHKKYGNAVNILFENQQEDESGLEMLLKHLIKICNSNKKFPEVQFKLVFHALAVAYENDPLLMFKFLVVLLRMTGFDFKDVLSLTGVMFKSELEVTERSQRIFLELLDVLEETKLDLRSKIGEVTVTDLLKSIITNSILCYTPSTLNYQLLKKIVILDPTLTQTLTEEILQYIVLANNEGQAEDYELLMLEIFDTFSKLHRIENLVSKIISVLNNYFDAKTEESFDLKTENVLTKKILDSFSRNIESLASWQVINVFKTFLFSLKKLVGNANGFQSGNIQYCFHMEFLSELIGNFLSSIRVAEHTVAVNVVEKTKKCLSELEVVLKNFGNGLLNRKHNCSLMRSFLNIAYYWAEVTLVLKYYSSNQDDNEVKSAADYNFAACNITYVHPYLTVDEWCLISERISNFGEISCKQLLYKLFIQKVRALYIFEQKVNEEILQDLSRYITRDLEENWKYILQNKFLTNNLVPLMDSSSINLLADKLVANITDLDDTQLNQYIFNNSCVLNAVAYSIIVKSDKIISKRKRKHDEDLVDAKKLSTKVSNMVTVDTFCNDGHNEDLIKKLKKVYESYKVDHNVEVKFNEAKLLELLEVLKKFPVVFCKESVQKCFLVYLFSLHKELRQDFSKGRYVDVQSSLENIILGMLQQHKYRLDDIFNMETICQEVLTSFNEWRDIFVLIIESVFKNKDAIANYESLIAHISDKLHIPTYMHCGIIILNTLNKFKKVKATKKAKDVADNYKLILCNKMYDLVVTNDPQDYLIPAYAYTLKTFLVQNEKEKMSKLVSILEPYTSFVLQRHEEYDKTGYLQLFNIVLHNKTKLSSASEDLPMQIWKVCKNNCKVYSRIDEYSQLIMLIVGYVSNDDFCTMTQDLLKISESLIKKSKHQQLKNLLKTWESVIASNINPVKTKNLQESVVLLLSQLVQLLENCICNKEIFDSVMNFGILVVKTNHFHLTPAMADILILTVTVLLNKENIDFQQSCTLSISLLSNLLKYRKSLIMDRLPPYLQEYRGLLKKICSESNADIPKEEDVVRQLADSAFQLEKLTKSLVVYQKDMSRIAMYLIADVLDQYEKVTILPIVKMHLNNCVYSLITICDQHAVSYLMRVLSSASTEIFKVMYDHYKKYYRFTGKA
ncbi:uncharacterized protein LOC114344224 [Diabrotica virgifera virgifera]|uniref:Uncharacterized protein LOC114344224 n=1 Tax=Diabrotica virgifera virgifera TaxID=50390 RepID=A0A6P7H4E5_DIAVI|nr:uncharacterized protein LOC114344224 [Diabrotica virgifera virgifera]